MSDTKKPMDIQTAYNVLDQAVASIQTTRANHLIISEAMQTIKEKLV
jgi:hypothetical protein